MDKAKAFFGGFVRKSSSAHDKQTRSTLTKKKEKALRNILAEGFEVEEDPEPREWQFPEPPKSVNSIFPLAKKSTSDPNINKNNQKKINDIMQKIYKESKREKEIMSDLANNIIESIKMGIPKTQEKALKARIASNETLRVVLKNEIIARNLPMCYREFLPKEDMEDATREIISKLFRESSGSSSEAILESTKRESFDEVLDLKKMIRS